MTNELAKLFIGSFYHSTKFENGLEYFKLAALGVDANGVIVLFRPIEQEFNSDAERKDVIDRELENIRIQGWKPKEILVLKIGQFIIPGFVDTHIHAPQYVFTGTGYDLTLLKWLETYTFPREAAFSDIEYAKKVYPKVVRKTISCGTTTACYYATTHATSSIVLAETCANLGQRAYIGKVNMDRNSPDYYIERTNDSITETIKFVKYVVEKIASPLVTPCITPRFVPSCTPELMRELGNLAKMHDLPIQSHLSETYGEIAWVKELHPDATSYSAVYDEYGLLNKKTVMAHCIHLEKKERDLLLEKGVGISHCPNSNFCLHSGVLNIKRLVAEGHEKIGLGTDCAGGYSPSLMDSMRQALIASKVVHIDSHLPESKHQYKSLNFAQVFHLATLGGAKVMALDDKIGNFMVGKEFDALVIDLEARDGKKSLLLDPVREVACTNLDIFPHDDHLAVFEKFVYLGDDRAISRVFVRGVQVIIVENPEVFSERPGTCPPLFKNVSNSLPPTFLWGYASSATQVEGAVDKDGKSPSDWDVFATKSGSILDGTTPGITINEYERWEDTIELLKLAGVNAYRFSIPWTRLVPLGLKGSAVNQKAVNHYNNYINKLIENGITPMVTLFHYDTPQILIDTYGSVLNTERFSEDFAYYAEVAFLKFGDRVKHWTTFNEPTSVCLLGYGVGMHAPGYGFAHFHLNFPWQLMRCGHSLLIAHAKAVQIFRKKYQPIQKGFITMVCNIQWGEPITKDPRNVAAAQSYIDFSYGWFADAIHFGDYPESFKKRFSWFGILPKFTQAEKALLKKSYDYVGINQYTTTYVGHSGFKVPFKDPDMIPANPFAPFVAFHNNLQGEFIGNGKAASTWLFSVPWGMTKSLEYIQKRYDNPEIYVMENGFSVPEENHLPMYELVHDVQRIYFFQDYLNAIQLAMKNSNVKVKAYIAWTLTDNFEWNSGFTTPFGVTKMDLKTGKRYAKDSAYYLKDYFRVAIRN